MERNLRRCKLNSFPASPINGTGVIEAFQLENVAQTFGKTRHDVPYEFYKGTLVQSNFECTFFSSESIINNIKTHIPKGKRHYFLDATFKIVPFGTFKQILILYVEYLGKMYPFIYVLMNKKTEESYKNIFQYIEENIFKLEPDSFTTDYEKAMRNGLKAVYKNVLLVSCWFHYCQALRRRCSKIKDFFNYIASNEAADSVSQIFGTTTSTVR